MPDKLPNGWARAKFHEVVRHHSGASSLIKGRLHNTSGHGRIPAFSASGQDVWADVSTGEGDATIVSAIGARCGKAFLASGKWAAIANTHVVWPERLGVHPKFLWYRINDEQFWERGGTAQPFILVRKTFEREWDLPPLKEQERIVAKLDALLSRVVSGEAAARRALDRLQRYRAAVLHAGVTGELTRDWRKTHPPEETGAQLLNRMVKVRRSRWELRWLTGKLTRYVDDLKKSKIPALRFSVLEESLRQLCSFRDKVQTSSSWDGDWKVQWNKFKSIKLELSKTAKKQALGAEVGIKRYRRDFTYLQSDDWKSKFYSEAEKPEMAELPKLPTTWSWVSVDQLAAHEPRSITDGPFGSHLKSSHYTNSGPRVIRLQNIGDGVFIDEVAHISRKHYEFLKEHAIYAGDLVIRALGIPAPRACRIPDIGPAIVKADCIRFKVAEDFIDSSFVLFALNSPMTQHRTEKKIHGVGRPRLNLGEIKSIALPLPPQKEQKHIAQEIERRLAAADRLAATLNRQLERGQVTRQSLLREAFTGNLVPQDPSDEPASALLERIRAVRESEAKKPKAKRMPKAKSKMVRQPILDILREHKKPVSPEQLFREAGFQPNEADAFYRELTSLRKQLRETKPAGAQARAWPYRAKVLLELKKH